MSKPIAIITGAGRGIGRAAAIELVRLGHQVAFVSRTESELTETAQLCGGGQVVPADVSRPDEVQSAVDRVIAKHGRVDVLVHAAGIAPRVATAELTIEQWRSTIDISLSAMFYFWRVLFPIWRKQGGGVMVNVSSVAARDPLSGFGAYGAAKAGMNILGLVLAREGDSAGIRVHTVAPAATETSLFRTILTTEQFPTEKTLDPADVARTIGQCVAGDLRYTSGEVIYMHKRI